MATHVQRSVCKAHVSFNAEAQVRRLLCTCAPYGARVITSVVVSPGQRYDGHYLPSLIESDLAQVPRTGHKSGSLARKGVTNAPKKHGKEHPRARTPLN